ncbi:MAG: NnrS family protein [Thiolinea sp.]
MLQIESEHRGGPAALQLGFRPFFLVALLGALLLGGLWTAVYSFNRDILPAAYPFLSWHAHEMIFGYTLAVASGFLLTAVRNWTHLTTLQGPGLLILVLIWVSLRLLPLFFVTPLWLLAGLEILFIALVLGFAVRPIIQRQQWSQLVIPAWLGLLIPASLLFHLGLMGQLTAGIQLGLYLGLYVFVGLILVMGRRVIPGFIENAIGGGFHAYNDRWLDGISQVLFLLFLITELVALATGGMKMAFLNAIIALVLFLLHTARLSGWHHRGLWLHPLLWSLYLAYAWMAIGFLLKFLVLAVDVNPWAALHAFTYGGIGLMTAGMMARVTLGHTGRNVFAPPPGLGIIFGVLMAGALVRVFLVWLWPAHYQVWILAAQILWLVAFAGLLLVLAPMLVKPRVDGLYG